MSGLANPPARAGTAAEIVDAVRREAWSRRNLTQPTERPSYDSPADPVKAVVLSIVAAAIGRDIVEPDLSFGAIGGDSLAATRVLAGVWQALDVRLPLSSLRPDTEVRSFLTLVEARYRRPGGRVPAGEVFARRARGGGPERLTAAQSALWLSAELGGPEAKSTTTVPIALRLKGELDPAALRDSLDALVRRHQALSLEISAQSGALMQRHCPGGLGELPVIEAGTDYTSLASNHARMWVDPGEPPLFRPMLLRIEPADHLLVIATNHLACDAWSIKVLLSELAALYGAAVTTGASAPLRDEPVGFLEFVRWQSRHISRDEGRLVSHWRKSLRSLPPERWLPTDYDRPTNRTGAGAAEHFSVDRSLFAELRVFSGEQGATMFMALLAGYAVVLADFSGATDLVIGCPMANRSHPALAGTVGYLSNTVPIRIDLSGEPTVRELIGRVRQASLDAYDHQDLPLPKLIAALAPKRNLGVPPVFQACLVLNEMQAIPLYGLEVEETILHNSTSPYDLTLYLEERSDSLHGYLEYPTDLFRRETAGELRRLMTSVLAGMVSSPDAMAMHLLAEPSALAR